MRQGTARLLSLPPPRDLPDPTVSLPATVAPSVAPGGVPAVLPAVPVESTSIVATRRGRGKATASSAPHSSHLDVAPAVVSREDTAAAVLDAYVAAADGGLTGTFVPDAGFWPTHKLGKQSRSRDAAGKRSGVKKEPGSHTRTATSSSSSSSSSSGTMGVRDVSRLTGLDVRHPEHVMKVTSDRIYSIAMHPSPDRIIALCGGKEGRLGIWMPRVEGLGHAATSEEPAAKRGRHDKSEDGDGEVEGGSSGKRGALAVEEDDDDDEDVTSAAFWPHSAPINYFHVSAAVCPMCLHA